MVTISQLIVALVEIEKKHGDLPLVEVIEKTDKFGVSRLLLIE